MSASCRGDRVLWLRDRLVGIVGVGWRCRSKLSRRLLRGRDSRGSRRTGRLCHLISRNGDLNCDTVSVLIVNDGIGGEDDDSPTDSIRFHVDDTVGVLGVQCW